MAVQIVRSTEQTAPPLILTIYAGGGVGKTTLATTAPSPIFIDAEHGTKALGSRGINVPIVHVKSWYDIQDAWRLIQNNPEFKTVVIDPIGAFLELLIATQKSGGEMNIKKWGEVKDRMTQFIIAARDNGKHIVFVAHEDEDKDDDQVLRRPMLKANLSTMLVNISDVVGHLRVDAQGKRRLRVQPEPKYVAKDRFDALGEIIDQPNITEMIQKIHAAYDKPPFESKVTPMKEPEATDYVKKMATARANAKSQTP